MAKTQGRILTITLPMPVYEKLVQYCESMSLKKSTALTVLIQQALQANMAVDGLQQMMDMIKAQERENSTDGKYSASNQMQFNHSPLSVEEREQVKLESKSRKSKK